MKFALVFDNTGDEIHFDIVYNHDIFLHFVDKIQQEKCNSFTDAGKISRVVDIYLNDIHNALCMTNSVMHDLCGLRFAENHDRLEYLDQKFLNRQHEQWVFSQQEKINIDSLRFSENKHISSLGWRLHEQYPDHIREIKLAEAMIKLGYIFPYEEVNMTVHRLEGFFSQNIEFKSDQKWQVFDNPFQHSMISNNDIVNFGFAYTYVGRQYYNKWQFYDTELDCKDHYNYETLEMAFQINLDRPQTVPYSQEFLDWCRERDVPAITTQIPIANAVDLEHNLKHYRTLLYRNSRSGNRASVQIN